MTSKKIPILHSFEICDKVEEENGKFSFHGIFRNIYARTLPAIHPHLSIALGFSNGQGKFKGNIEIVNHSNVVIRTQTFELDFPEEYMELYQVTNFNNTQLVEIGKYTVKVYLDGKHISERYFGVLILSPPERTKEEIEELLKNDSVIKAVQISLDCIHCKTEYKFQVNLDPSKPLDSGVTPWPEDNIFSCPNDDWVIDLTGLKLSIMSLLGTEKPSEVDVPI